MKKLSILIGLAAMILATGCSNGTDVPNKIEEETVVVDTLIKDDFSSENSLSSALKLLGQTDEESERFGDGGKKNISADGAYLIGRIYEFNVFNEDTTLYTSYRDDGIVNAVNFTLKGKEAQVYSDLIEEYFGTPTEVNTTPSESGATYTMWNVEGQLIYLYKDYASISIQMLLPDTLAPSTADEESQSEAIHNIMAEEKAYPELEAVIIQHYEIPDDYLDKTKYYYNYVDLNGDGKNEIFVVVMGPYTSGSGGSSAMIVYPVDDTLYVNQSFTLMRTPIIISDQMTNGAKEIIAYRSGGGSDSGYVKLTCSDGYYTTINEGEPLENLNGVTGNAIIANDLLKDMDNGRFLLLKSN